MDRTVRLWACIHSLGFLALGVYLLTRKAPWQTLWIVQAAAGMGVCSFATLFLLKGRSSVSIPNAVSLLRLVLTVMAAVFLFFVGRGYGVFTLFALAGLTDFFDGLPPRRPLRPACHFSGS
jgi:hypothetical protein